MQGRECLPCLGPLHQLLHNCTTFVWKQKCDLSSLTFSCCQNIIYFLSDRSSSFFRADSPKCVYRASGIYCLSSRVDVLPRASLCCSPQGEQCSDELMEWDFAYLQKRQGGISFSHGAGSSTASGFLGADGAGHPFPDVVEGLSFPRRGQSWQRGWTGTTWHLRDRTEEPGGDCEKGVGPTQVVSPAHTLRAVSRWGRVTSLRPLWKWLSSAQKTPRRRWTFPKVFNRVTHSSHKFSIFSKTD